MTRKSQACSKSTKKKKTRNSFASLRYGFFIVDTESASQYQQFDTTHLLVKDLGLSSISIEVNKTVFVLYYFLWKNSKHLKHKQKHFK